MNKPNYRLLIAHYRPDIVSGAEHSITDLVLQLDKRFQITMLVPGSGKLSSFFKKNGINVWEKAVSTPRRLFPGLHTIQSLLFARELRIAKFDAMLCNTIAAGYRVSSAAQMAGIPMAIHMRDYISNPATDNRILSRADAVFAISKDVKSAVVKFVPEKKVFLAYNFINPTPILQRSELHKTTNQHSLPYPNCDVVGWVGRITPYKQPEVFIQAIPIVLAAEPGTRFVIIGSAQQREKTYEAELKTLAQSLGVDQYIDFMGPRSDAIELSSELTVFCLTSKREPLGRVILEANLLHVPTVVPNTGGPAEIIDPGITGLQFDPRVPEAHQLLAQRILELLQNPGLRETMANNAFNKVKTSFASHDYVANLEQLYEKLCTHQL
jgi:glycosyltransferase involved in cell wall biosynthesis